MDTSDSLAGSHRSVIITPSSSARGTTLAVMASSVSRILPGQEYSVVAGVRREDCIAVPSIPELISSQYEVQLSEDEKNRYEQLKAELVLHLSDEEIAAANAASLTGKLVQLANGAIYTDTGDIVEFHDRKLDALEDLIEAANEKPVLVAYWFKHDLQRIKKRFAVRELKSSKDIGDWNNGKIPVAVIRPASAGHGLNLQAGGSTLI